MDTSDVKRNSGSRGMPDSFNYAVSRFDAARSAALKKVGTEIDLFVYALQKKQGTRTGGEAPVFNIYSPVGSIQTGDHSISNVTQNLDAEVRTKILDALHQISERLKDPNTFLAEPKAAIVELVDEGQQEIRKDKPNFTKLRSILSSVGGSIQTVASMKPAYEMLKQALTFLGISLP